MSAPRLARQRGDAPHICAACARPFVYPEFGLPEGGRWRVLLHCLSCDWFGERMLDDDALEDFERELDNEREQIELDLERLTQSNMSEYLNRFVAALAADAIFPEDF
jgi:hypothetical protein